MTANGQFWFVTLLHSYSEITSSIRTLLCLTGLTWRWGELTITFLKNDGPYKSLRGTHNRNFVKVCHLQTHGLGCKDNGCVRHSNIPFALTGEGKDHPRTGHEGPEGKQRYSCTLSLTSALDEVGGQGHAPAALPPGMRPGTHCIGSWVGPGPVWTGAENLAHIGIRSPDRPGQWRTEGGWGFQTPPPPEIRKVLQTVRNSEHLQAVQFKCWTQHVVSSGTRTTHFQNSNHCAFRLKKNQVHPKAQRGE